MASVVGGGFTALVIASFKLHAPKISSRMLKLQKFKLQKFKWQKFKLHGGSTRKCRANLGISVPAAARCGATENC